MTTSEIPHHRHRYPQGDLPPLATPGKTTPQTAPPIAPKDHGLASGSIGLACQRRTAPSWLHDARTEPSGEKASALMAAL